MKFSDLRFFAFCSLMPVFMVFLAVYDTYLIKTTKPAPLYVSSSATADFCDKRDPGYEQEACIWQRRNHPEQHPTCGGEHEAACHLESIFDR